jgi:hypothetical protein
MTYKHKDGFTYQADRFRADPKALYSIARAERLGELTRLGARSDQRATASRNWTRISARLGK